MNKKILFIILIILLISLTQVLSTTEPFTPGTIEGDIRRNKRRVRHMIRDGFTQMKSLFS